MAKAKGDGKVLATLGQTKTDFDKGCIIAKFHFDVTLANTEKITRMRDFHVSLEEPDRGGKRPALGAFTGRLGESKIPAAPKKLGVVTAVFDNEDTVNNALRQIGECEPATVYIVQTEQELEFERDEDEDDDAPYQTNIDNFRAEPDGDTDEDAA